MAETLKVLGQADPGVAAEGELYLANGVSAVCNTLSICNRDSAGTTVNVRIAIADAASSDEQFLIFEAPISANDTKFVTIGVTLADTDKIYVESANGLVAFQLFGMEVA